MSNGDTQTSPRACRETLRAAATQTHSQFLDVTDALRGHELCSAAAVQPTGTPDEGTAEWLRWIDLAGQGTLTESFHPNAFGQKALGRCLAIALLLPLDLSCHAVPGKSTAFVHVRLLH